MDGALPIGPRQNARAPWAPRQTRGPRAKRAGPAGGTWQRPGACCRLIGLPALAEGHCEHQRLAAMAFALDTEAEIKREESNVHTQMVL